MGVGTGDREFDIMGRCFITNCGKETIAAILKIAPKYEKMGYSIHITDCDDTHKGLWVKLPIHKDLTDFWRDVENAKPQPEIKCLFYALKEAISALEKRICNG